MDTTEINFPSDQAPELTLTSEAKYFLHTAGRWATFLGILGFIITGFIALAAIFAGGIISRMSQLQQVGDPSTYTNIMAAMGSFIRFFYILLAVFYFFFSYYLYQFGVGIKRGTLFSDSVKVTKALERLKSFFKLWGISTIVIIVLYILIIVGVIIFTVAAAAH